MASKRDVRKVMEEVRKGNNVIRHRRGSRKIYFNWVIDEEGNKYLKLEEEGAEERGFISEQDFQNLYVLLESSRLEWIWVREAVSVESKE